MPRFVVLVHDFPTLHWDLLLENSATLRAWRLLQPPDSPPPIPAEPLPDHRKVYLDYEGPVSGDRGTVSRWDVGEYLVVSDNQEALTIELAGAKLRGRYRLECFKERMQFVRA
jgi:hypothetical protein